MPRKVDPQQQKRNSTGRAIKKVLRDSGKIFDPSDEVLFVQEDSRLGMWVGVKLNRHAKLFELLAKEYFKGFEMHTYFADDRAWARFGYDHKGGVPAEVKEATEKAKKATA
jgi:hypothetical protein